MNHPFPTESRILPSEARLRHYVIVLIESSKFFSVMPLPDGKYELTTRVGEMPTVTIEDVKKAEHWLAFKGDCAIESLAALGNEARAIDDHMCSEDREDGPQPPNGDDYNELFSLVAHACGFPVSCNQRNGG